MPSLFRTRLHAQATPTVLTLLALVFLALTLGGCASLAPGPEPASPAQLAAWEAHSSRLKMLTDWAFDGRVAIKSGTTGGSVRLEWMQVGNVTALTMRGPFDTGRLAMTGTPDHMLITDGKGNRRLTDTPAQLLEQQIGWPIPLAALPHWLLGLPEAPLANRSTDSFQLDQAGRLLRLSEAGWELNYAQYAVESTGLSLPHFIELRRDETRIRVIVDGWNLGDAAP